jgi:hypothetical protein
VEESEDAHLKRLDDGTPANVDIFRGHIGGVFNYPSYTEQRQKSGLPEGQKYNSFDSEQFKNRLMWGQLLCHTNIQLKKTIHSYRDTD